MSPLTVSAITVIASYLIGSIPVAYLVARSVAGVDIRIAGEGNVGARNTFHVIGDRWGVVVFIGDFLKGAAVAAVFRNAPLWQLTVAGVAVFLGHAFPIWLRFIGGKGLSTVGGFAAAMMPLAALLGGLVALGVWAATRKFLPTLVTVTVIAIATAPVTGVPLEVVVLVVGLFLLTGVKRALDEPRMRRIEATTGWDRQNGLRG